MKNFKKYLKWFLIAASIMLILISFFLFSGEGKKEEHILWGVTFSIPQAEGLNLDWRAAYLAMLDDLKVRQFRLVAEWDRTEPQAGKFDFSSLDFELNELGKRGGKAIVALGMKVPRWPECHIPDWARGMSKERQQSEILALIHTTIVHLASSSAISAWQVENEPFLPFGTCPWLPDQTFLKKEIAEVKTVDVSRPVIITDSGELSLLFKVAELGDKVGTTLYKKVLNGQLHRYIAYPFSSAYYARRAWLIEHLFGKEVIDVELQAEPWTEKGIPNTSKEEIEKTMSLDQFRKNIEFASHAGHREIYLWGVEWWYYLKEKNQPEFWNEAKLLFKENR